MTIRPMNARCSDPLHEHAAPASAEPSPVLVEVTRGGMVESRHRAIVAVVDTAGRVVLRIGDAERPIYARSAIKPLQALALVETGAAEAFGLGDAEIALACASHGGEPRHVATVEAWLARIGCTEEDLECGAHLPSHEPSAAALLRAGGQARAVHNNCSGKHAGFLTVARHLGYPTRGYVAWEHPVQQYLLGVLEQMTGLDLGEAPRGIDGCGIPQIGIPLGNLALAMARLADPDDLPVRRREAARRIHRAMAAEPFMVAGTGRFCTRALEAAGGRALVKTGAEGVYCAALPQQGLGIALKVEDGAGRAASVLMGALLVKFEALGPAEAGRLADALRPPIVNRRGEAVGEIRIAVDAPL